MAMNPDTNMMEMLNEEDQPKSALDLLRGHAPEPHDRILPRLLRPNGEPVPDHWSTYQQGEEVVVKNYRWVVAHIGEKHLLLEPVGPVLVGEKKP